MEKIGPFAIEMPEKIVELNGTALSHSDAPDLAYMYRPIVPPVSRATRFAFRVILTLEEGHTLLARFNDLEATIQKPAEDETPAKDDELPF